MKTWADFYDFCHADVPGVSVFAAERELRRSAQEFFKKTKVWKVDLDPVYVVPLTDTYELDVPPGSTIVKVSEASFKNRGIGLMAPGMTHSHGIQFLTQQQFRIVPMPNDRRQIQFEAVLMPSNVSTGLDDPFFEQYAEIIACGAKARLYAQPQKTYTDRMLAAEELEKFTLSIFRTRIAASKGYSGAPLRIKSQFL